MADNTPLVPSAWREEHRTYLNELRESGVTNMFGAGPYLEDAFSLDKRDAQKVLLHWMATFTAKES